MIILASCWRCSTSNRFLIRSIRWLCNVLTFLTLLTIPNVQAQTRPRLVSIAYNKHLDIGLPFDFVDRTNFSDHEKLSAPGFNFLWLIHSRMNSQQAQAGRGTDAVHAKGSYKLGSGARLQSSMSRKLLRLLKVPYIPQQDSSEALGNAANASDSSGTLEVNQILSGGHIGFEMEFRIDNSSGSGYIITGRSMDNYRRWTRRRSVPLTKTTGSRKSKRKSKGRDQNSPTWFGLYCKMLNNSYNLQLEYYSTISGEKLKFTINLLAEGFRFGDWNKLATRIDYELNIVDFWLNCSHTRIIPSLLNRSINNTFFHVFRLLTHTPSIDRPVQVSFRSLVVSDGQAASAPKQCFSLPAVACSGGRVFMECGPSCEQKCTNTKRLSLHSCAAMCVRGCHCPVGKVIDRGQCVPVSNCSCRIGSTHYAAAQQKFINNEMCTCRRGEWKCFAIAEMTRTPSNRTIFKGNSTVLTCAVTGNPLPEIRWSTPPNAAYRTERANGNRLSRLFLNNVTRNESGLYSCVARRDFDGWTASSVARVDVISPPVVTLPDTISLTLGSPTAEMDCVTDGMPPPRTAWIKFRSKLPPGYSVSIEPAGVFRLHLVNISRSFAGVYLCVAKNKAGYSFKKVTVVVKLPPPTSVSFRRHPVNLVIRRGRTAIFPCRIFDHLPTTKVTWYKDGRPIMANGRRIVKQTYQLVVRKVSVRDAGTYTCSVDQGDNEPMKRSAQLTLKGRFSRWSSWSKCSASCGAATRSKTRHCSGHQSNKFTCRGKRKIVKNCKLQVCPGVCSSYGDASYTTYDGYHFNFQGDCGYILSTDTFSEHFKIVQYSVACGVHLSCTESVTVLLRFPSLSAYVEIRRDRSVLINRVPITIPYVSAVGTPNMFTVAQIGLNLVLRVGELLEVRWAIPLQMYVLVSGQYKRKIAGLCGNFNDMDNDDLKSKDGEAGDNMLQFAHSWSEPKGGTNTTCSYVRTVDNSCTRVAAAKRTRARDVCSYLDEERFRDCHRVVSPERFKSTCASDICASPMQENNLYLCTAFAAYAEECLRKGVVLNWRSADLCKITCPANQSYHECGPKCLRYCPTLVKNKTICVSHNQCLPGCYCNSRKVQHEGKCISVADCPCSYKGMLFAPREVHYRSCQQCTCTLGQWVCSFDDLLCDYPASVIRGPQSQVVPFGQSLTFCCGVVGLPVPSVSWFKDGEPLAAGWRREDGSNSSADDTNATLHLRNISYNDAGTYSCKATNAFGSHNSEVAFLTVNDPTVLSCNHQPQTNPVSLPEGCFLSSAHERMTYGDNVIDLGRCSSNPCFSPSRPHRRRKCSLTSHCCQVQVAEPVQVTCRHQLYNTTFHITVVKRCACSLCKTQMTFVEGVIKSAITGKRMSFTKIMHQGRTVDYSSNSGSFRISFHNIAAEVRHITLTFVDVFLKNHSTVVKNVLVVPGQSTIHEIVMFPVQKTKTFRPTMGLRFNFNKHYRIPYRMRLTVPPHSLAIKGAQNRQRKTRKRKVATARISFFNQNNIHRYSRNAEPVGSSVAIRLNGDEEIFSPLFILSVSMRKSNGALLDLIPGNWATLVMRFSSVKQNLVPWFLDNITGYWREDSEQLSVMPLYSKGKQFLEVKATIKRFNTMWAVGTSVPPCYLRAQVLDVQNQTVPGVKVTFTNNYGLLTAPKQALRRKHRQSRQKNFKFHVEGLTHDTGHSNMLCLPVGCRHVGILYASSLDNDLVLLEPDKPPNGLGRVRVLGGRHQRKRSLLMANKVLDTNFRRNSSRRRERHYGYFQSKSDCNSMRSPQYQTYVFRDKSHMRYDFNNRVIEVPGREEGDNGIRHTATTKYCYIKYRVRFHPTFDHFPDQVNVLDSVTFKKTINSTNDDDPVLLGFSRVTLKEPLAYLSPPLSNDDQLGCIEYICGQNDMHSEDIVVFLSMRHAISDQDTIDITSNLAERPNCNFSIAAPDENDDYLATNERMRKSANKPPMNGGGYVRINTSSAQSEQQNSAFRFTDEAKFRHVFEGTRNDVAKRKCVSVPPNEAVSVYFECW